MNAHRSDELWVIVPKTWYQEGQSYYWEHASYPLELIFTDHNDANKQCTTNQTIITVKDCVYQMLIDRLQWAKTL